MTKAARFSNFSHSSPFRNAAMPLIYGIETGVRWKFSKPKKTDGAINMS